jgi:hypothetical protein
MNYILSQMRCCNPQPAARHGLAARPWRSTGACVGSGTILLLLPKCPLCIAAYIAVWTGASMAASIAGYLRYVAIAVFLTSLIFLVVVLQRFLIPQGHGRKVDRQA